MNGQFKQWYEALCKRYSVCYDNYEDLLQEAFEAGAKQEREACAKLVEVSDELEDWEIICGSDGRELLNAMAKAIRARACN